MSQEPGSQALHSKQEKPLPRFPDYPRNPAIDPEHIWLGGPTGSSYRTPAQTTRIKVYCARRDGTKCMRCMKVEESVDPFEVHHVRLPVCNNYSDNVQNMHPWCNKEERWGHPRPQAVPVHRTPTPKKERAELVLPETLDRLSDSRTTPSQVTNIENEPKYREASFNAVLDMADPAVKDPEKYMNRRQLMSYAMAYSGASQDAAYGYNRSLYAPRIGPLVELPELGGKIKTVRFRDAKDYKLTAEQLVKKYPKEGTAYAS